MSHLLPAAPFTFDSVRDLAKERAAKAYVPYEPPLADHWKNLTYDQHRDIRFKMEEGLWAKEKGLYSVDFFHPGWTAKKTVEVMEIVNGEARPVTFDRAMFDYGKQQVPADVPPPPGYAGWRARFPLNSPDYMDEFLVFLGASYFRAIPEKAPYGLSARGLSIDSGLPGVPEEFPDFQKFWLVKPAPGDRTLTIFALLDGPSASGAYQFTVTPGAQTVMDVQAELTLRRPVKQLGLAPFSSMFWYGEITHPKPYDFRPEIHDSDGLLMELADGSRQWRPLDQSPNGGFRHVTFSMEKPRRYALCQRDRSFASYQDPEALYHNRPSVTVEPVAGWEKGKLHLIEMPAHQETDDNVIVLWEPEPQAAPGTPFRVHYRLHWQRDPDTAGLFCVRETRHGHPVQRPDQLLFSVDFANPIHPEKNEKGNKKWDDFSALKPVVTCSNPAVKLVHAGLTDLSMSHVDDIPLGMGRAKDIHMPQVVRAFFVLEPGAATGDLDLTCELQDKSGKAVSERWLYLWRKP